MPASLAAHVADITDLALQPGTTATQIVLTRDAALVRMTSPRTDAADPAARLTLHNNGNPCAREVIAIRSLPRSAARQVDLRFACGATLRTLRIVDAGLGESRLTQAMPATINRVDVAAGAERLYGQLTPERPAAILPVAQAVWRAGTVLPMRANLTDVPEDLTHGYFALGFRHVVTGYDHLAFLAGLLLMAPTLTRLLALVTAFTVAHSLTLAASALGVFGPPAGLTEVAIALTVAYVGAANLMRLRREHIDAAGHGRWWLTFAFGLIHGFGLAYMLAGVAPSDGGLLIALLQFNAGVEVGQLAICVTPMLLVVALGRRSVSWRRLQKGGSWSLVGAGTYWTVQRLA